MSALEAIHSHYVSSRRIEVLSRLLGRSLPSHGSLLDVGCGDGALALRLKQQLPDLNITGIDTHLRPKTYIPVSAYDGQTIPGADKSYDYLIIIDVLHHCQDPENLLRECIRITRRRILIKDHLLHGTFSRATLEWMDRIGNKRHGVALPMEYWSESRWHQCWRSLSLHVESWNTNLGLYPFPFSLIFDRDLHFFAELAVP